MGMFLATTTQLAYLNIAVLVMFLFRPGQLSLSPLPQTSTSPWPAASTCIAPSAFYDHVAVLHYVSVAAVLASLYLGSHVRRVVAATAKDGAGLQAMDAGARTMLKLRGYMLLAVVLSAVAVGTAVSMQTYLLQIQYMVFSCMAQGVRAVVLAMDATIAVVCLYIYGHLLRDVLFAD